MTEAPADPPGDDRERVMRIVMARCPELSDGDLAALARPDPADTGIPASVADKILDVIGHMMDRLDRIERAVGDKS